MAEETKQIKLQIAAGKATPAPPVGPALGQHGLNIMDFCNAFNKRSQELGHTPGTILPVVITAKKDRSFDFIIKSPPAAVLLKNAAKIQKGSGEPNKNKVGKVTRAQLEEIFATKKDDMTAANVDAGVRTIAGTARSMGIEVEDAK